MEFQEIRRKLFQIEGVSQCMVKEHNAIKLYILHECDYLKWDYFCQAVQEHESYIIITKQFPYVTFRFPDREDQYHTSLSIFNALLDRKYYLVEKPPEKSLTIICKVTNLCNMDCQYCYDKPFREKLGHNRTLSFEDMEKIIDMATKHAQEVTIVFHGGEPTLAGKDFYRRVMSEIIPRYPYTTFDVCLQTNGTLLDDEWYDISKKYNISLSSSYSALSEVHRETKKGNQSVKEGENIFSVLPKIRAAKEKNLDIGVIDVVTKENHPMMIERYEFYKKNHMSAAFNSVDETGEAENHDFTFHTKQDMQQYLKNTTEYFTYWLNDKDGFLDRYASMYAQLLLTGICNTCNYGCECTGEWLGVNSNGDFYPCDRPLGENYRIGNLQEFNSVIEIYNAPNYRRFLNEREEKKINYCRKCIAYDYCKGGCPMEDLDANKTASKPNKYSCKMMKVNLTCMFRALLNTDIYKINPFMRAFLIHNNLILPGEIPELFQTMHREDMVEGLSYDSQTAKINSREFELFKTLNHPDQSKRLFDVVCDLGDEDASLEDNRIINYIEKLREHAEKIVREQEGIS